MKLTGDKQDSPVADLQYSLRVLCLKQDRLEERIEAWSSVILEYLQHLVENLAIPSLPTRGATELAHPSHADAHLHVHMGRTVFQQVSDAPIEALDSLPPLHEMAIGPSRTTITSLPASSATTMAATGVTTLTNKTTLNTLRNTAINSGSVAGSMNLTGMPRDAENRAKRFTEILKQKDLTDLTNQLKKLDALTGKRRISTRSSPWSPSRAIAHKQSSALTDRQESSSSLCSNAISSKKTRKAMMFRPGASIIMHPAFDLVCASVIMLNSVVIGIETELDAIGGPGSKPRYLMILGFACAAFFFVELCLRVWVSRMRYFLSEDKWWNIFDTVLVILSLFDFLELMFDMGAHGQQIGKGFKTVKMLRILRLLRVFRFFKELGLLALMIADSMISLMWAMLMLGIITYVFAILFTQHAAVYVDETDESDGSKQLLTQVKRQFGTLARTHYTLIQSMLGGVSWGEVCDTLTSASNPGVYVVFFLFYIAFTELAVLNIITGVFVDNAVETGRNQRDSMIQKERDVKERLVKELSVMFFDMDDDESGTLSWEELSEHLRDDTLRSYFSALGLKIDDMRKLFVMIDDQKSGEVLIEEYLEGCLRMKGNAKSIDLHNTHQVCRRVNKYSQEIFKSVCRCLGEMEHLCAKAGPAVGIGIVERGPLPAPPLSAPPPRLPTAPLTPLTLTTLMELNRHSPCKLDMVSGGDAVSNGITRDRALR